MHRRVLRPILCAGLIALGTAVEASSVAADTPTTAAAPTSAQLATLSPSEITLLDSGQPIDVVMDPTTGDIESVTAATSTGARPAISNRSICDSGDGCYSTDRTPYANQGFYGSAGTYSGSWPYRDGYQSGSHTVSACWTTNCGVKISPNSTVSFTSDVTGTSFTIY